MNILALDLATKLGFARIYNGKIEHGTENLATKRDQPDAQRWSNFRTALNQLATPELHAIYYEKVIGFGANAGYTVQLYAGWVAHLEHWALVNNIPLYPVGVMTIKKHWTGSGKADKAAMIREAKRRGFTPQDDNAADALGVLSFGLYDQGFPTPFSLPHLDGVKVVHPPKKAKNHVKQDAIPF